MTDEAGTTARTWWGSFSLQEGETGYWCVGPLQMWAQRAEREWRVHLLRGEEPAAEAQEVEVPTAREAPGPGDAEVHRFAFKEPVSKAKITPALADRSIIVKPEITLVLPPREETTLYVSTPLWLGLQLGSFAGALLSTPCHRPSDTWFGPNTREGEMCYASRTRARQLVDEVTRSPHRAISAVRIRNRAHSMLEFERIKLPVLNLSLFADRRGDLWTESVTLDREEDGDFAGLRLGKGAPDEAGGAGEAVLVAGPRERHEKGLSIRTFGGLLG